MSSPAICIRLSSQLTGFIAAWRFLSERMTYWPQLNCIDTIKGRFTLIVIWLRYLTCYPSSHPSPVWSASPDVLPWSSVLWSRVVFSKKGYSTRSDLNPFPSHTLCTRMFCRPSMSLDVSTSSHNSNIWSFSCEDAKASLGPCSVQSFARFLSHLISFPSQIFCSLLCTHVVITFLRNSRGPVLQYYTVFQLHASAACDIQLRKIPSLCAELIKHWKAILDFMTKTAPPQVSLGVKNKISYTFDFLFCI